MGLETFAFASPWILTTLLVLPILWKFLRITPPAPQRIRFPAVRLLLDLRSKEETPDTSPLWMVILRLLAATLLIVALAHPLFNPSAPLSGNGPLILVIDDGWAAARDWAARQDAIDRAIDQADRDGRNIVLLPTAPGPRGSAAAFTGLLGPSQARSIAAAIKPKAWRTNRLAALDTIKDVKFSGTPSVLWLSDGLDHNDAKNVTERLRRTGKLTVFTPNKLPHAIAPPKFGIDQFTLSVRRASILGESTAQVRATGSDGRLIAREAVHFKDRASTASATLDLPLELRNAITRLEIEGEKTAASVALLDTRWRRRPVGLVSETPLDNEPSLLSELYYIERALKPYSEIRRGTVNKLVADALAVIIVPDSAPLELSDRDRLSAWATKGGLVLRFAGPRLAQNVDDILVPVPLRRGIRALGGAMLWSKPAHLAPFNRGSPFFNLNLPDNVTITRQVLAEPSPDLGEKSWARLTDGTPLVTARKAGDGWIVLVHTTSNAAWSNLPLSGLFVEMLERIVSTSRGITGSGKGDRPLPPITLLNGYGHAVEPGPATEAINSGDFGSVTVTPKTPPGLYGDSSSRRALNLGPQVVGFQPIIRLPDGVSHQSYVPAAEFDLKPWLLFATLVLFMIDAVATLIMRGLLPQLSPGSTIACLSIASLMLSATDGDAQFFDEDFALKASLETRLAYVITGDPTVDDTSLQGLVGLSRILNKRTAIEAATPIGINIDTDPLSLFPLLYWPVTKTQQRASSETNGRLNRFMGSGGTILFDLLDGSNGNGAAILRRLTQGLDIPPLTPVPPTHVLTKAFYLMQSFPGRWADSRVWVERPGVTANDGVSSIVVGANNWAAAWAVDDQGRHLFATVPGGERQREMAYRFGVNLMMYALTGNYKSDQVHVPSILERLGN